MGSQLTYYIFDGILTGIANGKVVFMPALSGGGGGSTRRRGSDAVNNPYMEGLKTAGAATSVVHVHGGPIPPGTYTVQKPAQHKHLGLSAQLVHPKWRPMGRDGFYIHWRGPHGSDGCIVPLHQNQFLDLMDALTKSNGGSLVVEEAMGGGRFG